MPPTRGEAVTHLCFLALLLPALAEAAPLRKVATIAVGSAGWGKVELIDDGTSREAEGWLSGYTVRLAEGCTTSSVEFYLVDFWGVTGIGTPAAAPPAEYRTVAADSTPAVVSAQEPTLFVSFTAPHPYHGGLGAWYLATGGTTCTFVVSLWGTK